LAVLSLSIVALGAAGCDGGGEGAAKYFPMKIGATWNFIVTPANGVALTETKQNTEGSPSTLTQTHNLGSAYSYTESFELDPSGIFITGSTYAYATEQETYSPPLLLLPSNTTPGFSTSTTSTETEQGSTNATDTVTVVGTVDGIEAVTVPAGTFSALRVTRLFTRPDGTTTGMQWYAPGVGAVKMVAKDSLQAVQETCELTSYNIP
jgi:hypothetical protein